MIYDCHHTHSTHPSRSPENTRFPLEIEKKSKKMRFFSVWVLAF